MTWRGTQTASRNRYLAKFDEAEAGTYHSLVGNPTPEEMAAYRADLDWVFSFRAGMRVLDAGAGTGALSRILSRYDGLRLTALEPSPAMLAILRIQPELANIAAVSGFCDAIQDRDLFGAGSFDVIVSRQLANGLFDPLMAFSNWRHWLVPGGTALVIDGLYGRSAWSGAWAEEADVLPLAATQSTATIPYLMESAGFQIEAVKMMPAVNALPSTRTHRYVVAGRNTRRSPR